MLAGEFVVEIDGHCLGTDIGNASLEAAVGLDHEPLGQFAVVEHLLERLAVVLAESFLGAVPVGLLGRDVDRRLLALLHTDQRLLQTRDDRIVADVDGQRLVHPARALLQQALLLGEHTV